MRLLFSIIILPPLLLILSCTSLSKNDLRLDAKQDLLIQNYVKAKHEKNCLALSLLSQDNSFLLKDLALLRARTVCQDVHQLSAIDDELIQQNPFYKKINNQRLLAEAEKEMDALKLAQAWRALALDSDRTLEKYEFLEKALGYAQKANDQSLEQELQECIYKVAPRFLPAPQPADFQKVAADFLLNREFKKGREYLAKIYLSTHFSYQDQLIAKKLYRNSFKTEQKKDEYLIETKKYTAWIESKKNFDPKHLHEAYLTWARATWTQGNSLAAEKILESAEKKLKQKYPMDEIEYVRGRIQEEKQNFSKALEHYEKAYLQTRPQSVLKDRILFSKAWALRKLQKFAEAANALEELKNSSQDPFDRFRYQFWLARSLLQSEQNEKAIIELNELKQEDHLGYYGLLAYRQLKQELPALNVRAPASLLETKIDRTSIQFINALIAAEENETLEKYLDLKSTELTDKGITDSASWTLILKSYAQAGLYLPLFAKIGSLDNTAKMQLLKDHPDLLFPRKYQDLIAASADKFQVPKELILSIIRQESAFNPFARSPADAFGLMQVLPSVATDHEHLTGIKVNDFHELYIPEKNIPVGSALLSDLSKKYRKQFLLITAAYNANEKAIHNWLQTRLDEDPLEFIEDIPYEETRAYVKLVLRNFIFYSRLNSPGTPLAFPEWCLENLQSFKLSTR